MISAVNAWIERMLVPLLVLSMVNLAWSAWQHDIVWIVLSAVACACWTVEVLRS